MYAIIHHKSDENVFHNSRFYHDIFRYCHLAVITSDLCIAANGKTLRRMVHIVEYFGWIKNSGSVLCNVGKTENNYSSEKSRVKTTK